jgi:hypothetical protein
MVTKLTNITTLSPRDPIFALAPELKLHLSELDGQLVVNSREVARVFFHYNHRQLLRHIMWNIWHTPMQPNYEDEFRQRPDGTVDITASGLTGALGHQRNNRQRRAKSNGIMATWAVNNSTCNPVIHRPQ